MLSTPKLLPWYARQAGVTLGRAEALWPVAVNNARAICVSDDPSEFWGAAIAQLRILLQEEASKLFFPRMNALLHSQMTLWRLPITAMESALEAASLKRAA